MALVIIGGGVIGLSVAYYSCITQPRRKITIIDSEKELLLSASGFSGGYIVRDWFATDVLPLAELSYLLHKDLADSNNGRKLWGYSESIAYSAVIEDINGRGAPVRGEDWLLTGTSRAEVAKKYTSGSNKGKVGSDKASTDGLLRPDGSPRWANVPAGGKLEQISTVDGCAQLEPRQFCEWLIQRCRACGVEILLDTNATGLINDHRGNMAGIFLERGSSGETTVLPCKDIVIAAGSWTPRVYRTLMKRKMEIGIRSLPGYSIVVRSPRYNRPIVQANGAGIVAETSHAVFYPPCSDWSYSPEAMARMTQDGRPEIFIAGLNDESLPLPRTAGDIKTLMDPEKLNDLKRTAIALTGIAEKDGFADDLEVVREGLCYRPVSNSGRPIISKVSNIETSSPGGGIYVAGGHGPWGITLSLGTGLVVSELLQGKHPSVSLEAFTLPSSAPLLSARL